MTRQRPHDNPYKLIEQLSENTHQIIGEVLAHDSLKHEWPRAWCVVADDRLELAEAHLSAAELVEEASSDPDDCHLKRAVISRAYYAMFCAARAALSLETNGDVNDHKKLPDILKKTETLGSVEDRNAVVSAVAQFRSMRNEADYSPYY